MREKATVNPHKCPLEKTQLRLSRILTKETKKIPDHTCPSSHRLGFSNQTSEAPQSCRCSCEKRITPRLSLGSHQGLNSLFCTEKNNWWGAALPAHTLMCVSVTVGTKLWQELRTPRQWSQVTLGLLKRKSLLSEKKFKPLQNLGSLFFKCKVRTTQVAWPGIC